MAMFFFDCECVVFCSRKFRVRVWGVSTRLMALLTLVGFFFWLLCFFLQSKISGARVGRIHTPHGTIDTPGYVPVATIAAQKAVDHRLMDEVLCR